MATPINRKWVLEPDFDICTLESASENIAPHTPGVLVLIAQTGRVIRIKNCDNILDEIAYETRRPNIAVHEPDTVAYRAYSDRGNKVPTVETLLARNIEADRLAKKHTPAVND